MHLMQNQRLGQYLNLEEFCTCTQTYRKFADSFATRGRARINPYTKNPAETIPAIEALCQHILDPIIDHFGRERFQLTYGFCSIDLKRYLAQKDPETGIKNGRVAPSLDQHMAHEKNRNGKYCCDRPGAACDFRIVGLEGDRLIEWILEKRLPFDSLYYYGNDRPIHTSYGLRYKRSIWVFTERGVPKTKGIEDWLSLTNGVVAEVH